MMPMMEATVKALDQGSILQSFISAKKFSF
jgi:hypothetical protein